MKKNIISNFFFGSEAAKEMFSTVAESVETVAAESAEPQIEAGEGDLEKFFGEVAEEQRVADAKAEAAREVERQRLIRQYANSFKDRILREIQNKDWDRLIRAYEKSSEEEDFLTRETAILYNERVMKSLPPSWWEKRAPELQTIRDGQFGAFEILLAVVRSEVSQRANVHRQAAASNLLRLVKAAAEELGLADSELPHKPLSGVDNTEEAAREIGKKCLILATARAVRKSLLALRDQHVRIPKAAEQAFYLITTSRSQKWGVILMALCQLVRSWEQLEQDLTSRPGAPVEKLKKKFFTVTLEERAIQVAGRCHLDLNKEVDIILRSAGNKD